MFRARCFPKALTCEQALEAHLAGAIDQDGVEGEFG
jgi:hypothetical protein